MKSKVPHNVLTISEMTKRPNKISSELLSAADIVLDEETVKKLRASSSICNKSVYVQILHDGTRYNVENVEKSKDGVYKISLISTTAYLTLEGGAGEKVSVTNFRAL